jgi:phosphomannomutase
MRTTRRESAANPSRDRAGIFGAYDVRGRFPSEIGSGEIARLARALALTGRGPLLVARDVRRESALFGRRLVEMLRRNGRTVEDLGIQPTPAVAFAAARFQCTGLAVTPSHNAIGYVGLKGFDARGRLFSREWSRIRARYLSTALNRRLVPAPVRAEGRWARSPLRVAGWTEKYLAHVTRERSSRLAVVVDSRGGAAARIGPRALARIGARVTAMNPRFSPTFYGLSPEPSEANIGPLSERVRSEHADLGVTFDGDGDRVAFVDSRGRWVEPEVTALFLYRHLSPRTRPLVASVDASVRCEAKAPIVRSRVGGRFVLRKMQESGAVVGFERSCHYYLKDLDRNSDGVLVACEFAHWLDRTGSTAERLVDAFGPIIRETATYAFETRAEAARAFRWLRRRLAREGGRSGRIEGFRVCREGGSVLFRLSNTQPAIRAVIEADDEHRLESVRSELDATVARRLSFVQAKEADGIPHTP